MLTTQNFKFKKIELSDSPPDITVLNFNWDTIDIKLKEAFALRDSGGTIDGPVRIGGTNPLTVYQLKAISEGDQIWSEGGIYPYATDKYNQGNAQFKWSEVWGKKACFDRFIRRTTATTIQHGQTAAFGIESSDESDKITVGVGLFGVNKTLYPGQTKDYDLGTTDYRWRDLWLGNYDKSRNGYTRLPNGMIMQWGYITNAGSGVITFPVAFSGAANYNFQLCPCGSADASALSWRTDLVNAGNISFYSTRVYNFYWFAIGW